MAARRFSTEELNFFKFASIVYDEFPTMLRSIFVTLWDSKIAPLAGNKTWDDTPIVRNLFLGCEGGRTKIPTSKSFEDWDCTALFNATIYAKTFATSTKTLKDQFIQGKNPNPFHSTLISPTGNNDETIALATDQIRLLRNALCHLPHPTIEKATFDDYVQLAKDAFAAVKFPTCQIDYIGNLDEKEFPTEKVDELKRKIRDVELENYNFLKENVDKKITTLTDDCQHNKQFRESMMLKIDEIIAKIPEMIWDSPRDISCEGGELVIRVGLENVLKTLIHLPQFQHAIKRCFGGDDRNDQEFKKFKEGSVIVPLNCFTDKRFLEVLNDFESGRLKERLLKEFSWIGVKAEEMKIEIINIEEVNKTKEAIKIKNTAKMWNAIKKGDTEEVRRLVPAYVDVNGKVTEELSLLHLATQFGSLDIVKHLVEHGAEVASDDNSCLETVLHSACRGGSDTIVQYLLQHGAAKDINRKNPSGRLPLSVACSNYHIAVVQTLVKAHDDAKCRSLLCHLNLTAEDEIFLRLIERLSVDSDEKYMGDDFSKEAQPKAFDERPLAIHPSEFIAQDLEEDDFPKGIVNSEYSMKREVHEVVGSVAPPLYVGVMSYQSLIECYVHGIINQPRGVQVVEGVDGVMMYEFDKCRNEVRQRLNTLEWLLLGLDAKVINVVMRMGDEFFRTGNIEMALNFYREAGYLFPETGICLIREAQCLIELDYFDQAKKACRKAIRFGDHTQYAELLPVIDIFEHYERLRDAYDLYKSLMEKYPGNLYFMERMRVLQISIWEKTERQKRSASKRQNVSQGTGGLTKSSGANGIQTSDKKLSEASGGTDQASGTDATQITETPKVAKTSKQLKRDAMAKNKELEREIQKASKEQEEKLKKQEELEARKKKEREEKKEMQRKQEVEERERREREEREKRKKQKERDKSNKAVRKEERSQHDVVRGVVPQSIPPDGPSSVNAPVLNNAKRSLNDMPKDFDRVLSSGSRIRLLCPKCNTPRAFEVLKCSSCDSELQIWYRKVSTTEWTKPRKPPTQEIRGPYEECKHYKQGERCVRTPCTFPHGPDELEIWELCRSRSKGSRPLAIPRPRSTTPSKKMKSQRGQFFLLQSLEKSRSCLTLNGYESSPGRRSRADSVSSRRSLQSFSNTFDVLSTDDFSEDMLDNFDSEFSNFLSQDAPYQLSQDSDALFPSSLLPHTETDACPTEGDSGQNREETPEEKDKGDDESDDSIWTTVERRRKPLAERILRKERTKRGKRRRKKKKPSTSSAKPSTPSSQTATNTVSVSSVMEQEELRCRFCDIKFSSMLELEYHYSDPQHKVNVIRLTEKLRKPIKKFRPPPDGVNMGRYKVCRRFVQGYCYFGKKCTFAHGEGERDYWKALYEQQNNQLTQLKEEHLLAESFSEKLRRRIKCGDQNHVLKKDLPGVTVKCNSPRQIKLEKTDRPQVEHTWIFDVRIQRNFQLMLSQVAFLLETHLDKFKLLRCNETSKHSSTAQCVRFQKEDFIEDSAKNESAVQFCIQFSSGVFGDFEQKLVFDFGQGSVLVRPLFVSVVSKDTSKEKSSRTRYCHIAEWSVDKMELVPCKELMRWDLEGLCERYSIPDVLPDPAKCPAFSREKYCNIWHQILLIEEKHIGTEVARYDIQDGFMQVVNKFACAEGTVFALPGEMFGVIDLPDYLVMDEVAGHLINRSVMSVILRLKLEKSHRNRVYECNIKSKTSQSVIIKLNEELCKDYDFAYDQVVQIDLKFKYNRRPMCEMHQAIDLCREKTDILLPNAKNASYKCKKLIHDWFMDRKPNPNQHEAISMILDPTPTPPILVIGPFGTGKTFTLSLACVAILNQSKTNKVLICTHSHSAAHIHLDHLDAKIQEKPLINIRPLHVVNWFRNVNTIPKELRKYCNIEEETNEIREPTLIDIRDNNVIITTLATARLLWKFYQDKKFCFTHILIDEAAQALEPESLTPFVMADENTKIVLAGDHQQMGPPAYSKWMWADEFGPKVSLLERLFNHYKQCNMSSNNPPEEGNEDTSYVETPYVVLLTENYRCHEKILQFPSDNFYGGELVARGDQTTYKKLPVLSFYTAQGVDKQDEEGLSYYNDAEVAEVVARVEDLIFHWPKNWKKNIGVLTPYRDQVKRIRDALRKKGLGYVDVETVENVQGKEFRALFISTVRTMWTCSVIEGRNEYPSELDFAFLSDSRFLNTAVTRAQSLLAVVGDPMSLCSVGACRDLWKDYLRRCEDNKALHGCTLKAVMDFCLCSQPLDPSVPEFKPSAGAGATSERPDTSNSSHSRGEEQSISSERTPSVAGAINSSSLNDSTTSTFPNQSFLLGSRPDIERHDGIDGNQDDRGGNLAVDNESTYDDDDAVVGEAENKSEDDSNINQATTEEFFHRDEDVFDKIIRELVKACQRTRKKDEDQRNAASEEFPLLTDNVPKPPAPHWPNTSTGLGFHVTGSEKYFRLTGGKSSKQSGDEKSWSPHDIDAFPREELANLVQRNPLLFTMCTFRINSGVGSQHYYGNLPTPDSPDIQIPGRIRGVYEDDVVMLEVQPSAWVQSEDGQKAECVTFGYIKGLWRRIIEPGERQFVCTIDRANPCVMVPINKNVPKLMNFTDTEKSIIPIYKIQDGDVSEASILSTKHYGEALAGERVFIVKILKWRTEFPFPLGIAIQHIPHGRDLETGMEILYQEHNIRKKFGKKLSKTVRRDFNENWQIPISERGRPEYRENVFTIDPQNSLDLDDAISLRSLGNGNYELRIHIADVSYFVLPNSDLDEEAKLRGTSYYPPDPDENVPMLPRQLSEGCCSLLEGKDRLALTVRVEVTLDGKVVGDAKMERSVICSSSRLSYLEAQQIIDDSSQTEVVANTQEEEIQVDEAIGIIHRFAEKRRKLRLGLERSMYHRKSDDDDDSGGENEREAHRMIEEVMVLANHLVAKYLLKKFPECTPLRVQPPPKTRRVVEWRQRFQRFLSFSLGLGWLGDSSNVAQEENADLMVPFQTWKAIMSEVQKGSNLQDLVKIVCDLDLFPQLSLASMHQQQIQQRGSYICSGDNFGNIPYPWVQDQKVAPTSMARVVRDDSSNLLRNWSEDCNERPEDGTEHGASSGNVEANATYGVSGTPPDVSSNVPPGQASFAAEDRETATEESTGHETGSENVDAPASSANEDFQLSSDVPISEDLRIILHGHSSLCLDAYCHFTSPIRRYIDIIVHRLVVAALENKQNVMDPEDVATICARSTFFARNSRLFDKGAKRLKLAVKMQSSLKFVSAYIDEIQPDNLKLFFGPGEMDLMGGKSVRIARLGPDKDPQPAGDGIRLHWIFRLLRLDKGGLAQPKPDSSDDEKSQKVGDIQQSEGASDLTEKNDDFDYTVDGKAWREVLDAVTNQNEGELKSRLKELDNEVKQQRNESDEKMTLLERVKKETDPLVRNAPYQHPNAGKPEPSESETYEFYELNRSFKTYSRVKVQVSPQMSRGVISPSVQLFKLTNQMYACIEHRSFPTTCFAKTSHRRPTKTKVSDIAEYVKVWKPVLMMEIATSAVHEDDVITFSNLRVNFERDSKGLVTMEFDLSDRYCKVHFLDPLDLNLLCVRAKDPANRSEKDAGFWVGHFQISEELRKKEDAKLLLEMMTEMQSAKDFLADETESIHNSQPENLPSPTRKVKPVNERYSQEKDFYRPILARLIDSSTPIPDSLIAKRFYVTVEFISLGIPDRRRLGALHDSVLASKLIQNICIGEAIQDLDVANELPSNDLSLCSEHHSLTNFHPLNKYQRNAVEKALTKPFTLIQGPPGTGKTVTGVHIAYWFAQMNKNRLPSVKLDRKKNNGSLVFYCGPSNKSVDVVARLLLKIPGIKILRIYGQEIERKEFPVPDKITLFRTRRVAVELKADKDLRDVSLHHVIRKESSPFWKKLEKYDKAFKLLTDSGKSASRYTIDKFTEVKSEAEEWAITETGVDVILATCTTAYSPRIKIPGFVCQCIVDECGMCIEAETLCAMLGSNAKQVVLIGDHKQLQPIIKCEKAKDLGLGISMFERYSERAHMLEIQYRMHEKLCEFPSHRFYDEKLKTAPEVKLRKPDNVSWPNGDRFPFVFHHVEGVEEFLVVPTEQGNERSQKNQKEVDKAVYLARRLVGEGIECKNIVILSPYRAQCFQISEKLRLHGLNEISVSSVVAAQGSERDYVILSLVRSLPEREIERNPSRSWLKEHLGFLTDEHQINVALTRAKRGLCIIGNSNLIGVCSLWRALLEHYDSKGCLKMDAE
ncbi:LOW QUALITY PROTEIN: uncharacterized protein LOC114516140 [Dendronephthya gigantea]|uniref:LOW QUALITY PROTEIN: uncharacterized protein LOC114516140 n=1 Tax=Dendronephthya gigantea TaxID=151771 RepID=UPI00106A2755|nr:LOW QUALITY PROTEIN: uncharacterized protein LOC114516140 [Dendronephthya gigantea]